MDNFIEKIQLQIEKKMISCVNGESIVRPFTNIYTEVRKNVLKKEEVLNSSNDLSNNSLYSKGEASIYSKVVKEFLKEHPELIEKNNMDLNDKNDKDTAFRLE